MEVSRSSRRHAKAGSAPAAGPNSTASEVAVASGRRSAGVSRFMPMPKTTQAKSSPLGTSAPGTSSQRMPPSFLPPQKRSLGHLSPSTKDSPGDSMSGGSTVLSRPLCLSTARSPSKQASPQALVSQPPPSSTSMRAGTAATRLATRVSPDLLCHVRSSRPRPAVCSSATTTSTGSGRPPAAAERAAASRGPARSSAWTSRPAPRR